MDVLEIAKRRGIGAADWIGDTMQEAEVSEAEYEEARRNLAARRRGEASDTVEDEPEASPPPRFRRFRRSP